MDPDHAEWRKSRHSAINGCVEVAFVENQVAVRDSKDRGGPILMFSDLEWRAFVRGVQDGDFDPA
jgi:uncharacterized protein DUF397